MKQEDRIITGSEANKIREELSEHTFYMDMANRGIDKFNEIIYKKMLEDIRNY